MIQNRKTNHYIYICFSNELICACEAGDTIWFETNPGVRNPPGFRQFPSNNPDPSQNLVPYWTNNAPNDNTIEIWRSGFQGVNAITESESSAAGDQYFPTGGGLYFNELNSKAAGRLSQSVNITKPGVLSLSMWSRGRAGEDTMRLEVQEKVNGTWQTVDIQTINGSATNTAWANHKKSDFLVVTPGEYRFEFVDRQQKLTVITRYFVVH